MLGARPLIVLKIANLRTKHDLGCWSVFAVYARSATTHRAQDCQFENLSRVRITGSRDDIFCRSATMNDDV